MEEDERLNELLGIGQEVNPLDAMLGVKPKPKSKKSKRKQQEEEEEPVYDYKYPSRELMIAYMGERADENLAKARLESRGTGEPSRNPDKMVALTLTLTC